MASFRRDRSWTYISICQQTMDPIRCQGPRSGAPPQDRVSRMGAYVNGQCNSCVFWVCISFPSMLFQSTDSTGIMYRRMFKSTSITLHLAWDWWLEARWPKTERGSVASVLARTKNSTPPLLGRWSSLISVQYLRRLTLSDSPRVEEQDYRTRTGWMWSIHHPSLYCRYVSPKLRQEPANFSKKCITSPKLRRQHLVTSWESSRKVTSTMRKAWYYSLQLSPSKLKWYCYLN